MPNKVFISYRREDSQYQARRIYDAFVHALPPDTVFMDVDSIAPGADFVEILEGWVQQCDILLALIGPRWLNSIDSRTNLRRLDNPEDFVRIEIRGALERKIPVVPVLLDATGMPTAAELPDDIKALRRKHAEFVDFRTFDVDVQRLIKKLKIGKVEQQPGKTPEPQAGDNGRRHTGVTWVATFLEQIKDAALTKQVLLATAALTLLLAVGMIISIMRDSRKSEIVTNVSDLLSERTAEVAKAQKAREEAEAKATAAAAAQAKSEEGRQAAETRAGEAADALAKTEKARQEAEAKAAAAVAAHARSEESRRAAEAHANDAADGLKKSDKARLDTEARAAAAQAKAEEAVRTAEKARLAAEATASAATTARVQADASRQAAEARANDAADALMKSEKARQEAETTADELRKLAYLPAPGTRLGGSRGAFMFGGESKASSRTLLTDIGDKSRWAIGGTLNCNAKDFNFFSLEVGSGSITWVNGFGRMSIETILASSENKFRTTTYISDTTENRGLTWDCSRDGDRIRVQPLGHSAYVLTRCP